MTLISDGRFCPSRTYRHLILIAAVFLSSTGVFAQDYQFKVKSIGVEDGLTNRTITAIFQDREGFMWFGTRYGLNRYDASRVTTYTLQKGDLVFNDIEWMSEDANDNFWIHGRDPNQNNELRIQVFDKRKGEAITLRDYLETDPPFDLDDIVTFQSFHSSQDLWIILPREIYLFDPELPNPVQKVYTSTENIAYYAAAPNGIWLLEEQKFKLIDRNGDTVKEIDRAGKAESGIFAVDNNGEIFYEDYQEGQIRIDNVIGSTLAHSGTNNEKVHPHLIKYRFAGVDPYQGHYWKTSPGGYTVFDLDGKVVTSFMWEEALYSYPKFIYFDRFGNGWANHEGRVNMFTIKKSKFTNYLTDIKVFGINSYGSRGLHLDDENNLYTNGLGLSYKINLATGERVEFGPGEKFYEGGGGDQGRFKRLALVDDQEGNLWYTDEGTRVAKYNIQTNQSTDYTYSQAEYRKNAESETPISFKVTWSAHIDRNGKLWLGRLNGLGYLDENDSSLHNLDDYGEFSELMKAGVYTFHENNEGIWFGSTTGLYLMDFSGKIRKRYHTNGADGSYIPYNTIAHIREDKDGLLWLASRGGGLISLDPAIGAYNQWTTENGLSDNIIYASFEDEFGFLWVSSNNGIMRIDKETFSVSTYLRGDGLSHEEFNTGSHLQVEDGRIFFGSIDGITMFNPADFVADNVEELNIRLTGLETQSKQTGLYLDNTSQLLASKNIHLNPDELGFVLNFSLLDYIDSEFNTFSYQIEELDADWNYIDIPSIRINALPYGTYSLKIRGQGPQGQWSNDITIPIIVVRPFYLRWWFFVIVGLILIVVIVAFIRYRERSLKETQERLENEVQTRTKTITEQAEELREMDKMKSRFFANVSHELRTPLTLILGPISNILKKEGIDTPMKKELLRVHRNGQNMSNLVEEILDLSKLDAKKLSVAENPTMVKEFFEVVFQNFLSHAHYKEVDYKYRFEGSDDLNIVLDQKLVERILNNLLSNAFKFTAQGGDISLNVVEKGEMIQVLVTDTGSGISDKDLPHIFERFFQTKESKIAIQGGTGIGLAMSKELSHLLGGDLTVDSTLGRGSTFLLELPKRVFQNKGSMVVSKDGELIDMAEPQDDLLDFGKSKLLIVEDNRDMQEFVKQVLSDFHSIDVRDNGKEGLNYFQDHKLPDIIISDIMMPEMDGLEFLRHVRENEATKHIPVLMLTARSAEEDKIEAFTLGVDDYLLKPFSTEELKARLRNLLKHAKSRKSFEDELLEGNNDDILSGNDGTDWLKKLEQITKENVDKVDFSINTLAEKMGLSERQFQRNLKKLTGLTPVVYLKEIRLQMARTFLERKQFEQVNQVSTAVGFTSSTYFSKLYRDRFGKLPKEYL